MVTREKALEAAKRFAYTTAYEKVEQQRTFCRNLAVLVAELTDLKVKAPEMEELCLNVSEEALKEWAEKIRTLHI